MELREIFIWLQNKNLVLKLEKESFEIKGFIRENKWISFSGEVSDIEIVMSELKQIDKVFK